MEYKIDVFLKNTEELVLTNQATSTGLMSIISNMTTMNLDDQEVFLEKLDTHGAAMIYTETSMDFAIFATKL